MTPLFSIVTPCYNSSQTLWATYQSLLDQPLGNFEWILVDDASTDNGKTRQLIQRIAGEAPFMVKTHFLSENHFGAKSTFTACTIASGEYVAVLDHDDQLYPGTLRVVEEYINLHGGDEFIAGICGRCIDENGILIGGKFESDSFIANEAEVRFSLGIRNELFQFSKREVIKPLFELMKPGYTNGFVWAKVSENFKYLYVNDVFRVYDTALPTSYSNTKGMKVRFPLAKAEALRSTILSYRPYLGLNIRYASQFIGSYLRHTINADMGIFSALRGLDPVLKMWCLCVYPISIMKSKGWL